MSHTPLSLSLHAYIIGPKWKGGKCNTSWEITELLGELAVLTEDLHSVLLHAHVCGNMHTDTQKLTN